MNNPKIGVLIFAIAMLAGLILFYNYTKKHTARGENFIEQIREDLKPGTDSLQNALRHENYLNRQIKKDIDNGNFSDAYAVMDSLPAFGKEYDTHLYQGMIYSEQKKYKEAIEEFTNLIKEDPAPITYDKRAKVYITINKLDSAIDDYKNAASINYDYDLQVANTFILLHKKDSALKYYKIFSKHYPGDSGVQRKINLLK
jgi:tetratricopeptide (TPR) repeat protein